MSSARSLKRRHDAARWRDARHPACGRPAARTPGVANLSPPEAPGAAARVFASAEVSLAAAVTAVDTVGAPSASPSPALAAASSGAWRVAEALLQLRRQVDAAWPERSRASDGTIGDASHQSRDSDHNPWVRDGGRGVVTALDLTHSPRQGLDIQRLADALVRSRDPRIKYIICNRRIVSSIVSPWTWRPYGGSNPHSRHVHVSVRQEPRHYDDTAAWTIR